MKVASWLTDEVTMMIAMQEYMVQAGEGMLNPLFPTTSEVRTLIA